MYKEDITYTDYNGQERTETLYFNLTKSELARMNMTMAGGMEAYIKSIIASQNGQEIMDLFDMILSKSYGQKSLDGRRFIKSPEIYKEFTETEAFNEFFFKLVTNAEYAGKFVEGIVSSALKDIPKVPVDFTGATTDDEKANKIIPIANDDDMFAIKDQLEVIKAQTDANIAGVIEATNNN